jgi:hypothetical protein
MKYILLICYNGEYNGDYNELVSQWVRYLQFGERRESLRRA